MKTPLLPCPFCGGRAIVRQIAPRYTEEQLVVAECSRVRCPVHPGTTPFDEKGVLRGKAGAVEAWNRRKVGGVNAKKKKKKEKPSRRPCTTCAGSGWVSSGVGHYGEQEGGVKAVTARCEHCLGMGYIEPGEGHE